MKTNFLLHCPTHYKSPCAVRPCDSTKHEPQGGRYCFSQSLFWCLFLMLAVSAKNLMLQANKKIPRSLVSQDECHLGISATTYATPRVLERHHMCLSKEKSIANADNFSDDDHLSIRWLKLQWTDVLSIAKKLARKFLSHRKYKSVEIGNDHH